MADSTINFSLQGEDAGLLTMLDQVNQRVGNLESRARGASGAMGEQASMGSQLMSTLGGIAAGYLSLETAIRAYAVGVDFANQKETEGLASLEKAFDARARIAQVAQSPEQKQQLVEDANHLRLKFGLDSEVAGRMVANLASAGLQSSEADAFALLPQGDELMRAAALAKNAFGADRVGSLREIANEAQAISSQAMPFSEELLANIAKAAPMARMAGATDEQALAVMGAIGSARKDSRQASTETSAVFSELQKAGIDVGKVGLLPALQQLRAGGTVKETRALAGLETALTSADQVSALERSALAASRATGLGDLTDVYTQKLLSGDDKLIVAKRIEEQRNLIAAEDRARTGGIQEDLAIKRIESASMALGESDFTTGLRVKAAEFAEGKLGLGEEGIRGASNIAAVLAEILTLTPAASNEEFNRTVDRFGQAVDKLLPQSQPEQRMMARNGGVVE